MASLKVTALHAISPKLLASCENWAAQYCTFAHMFKCELIFPRGDHLLAPEVFSCMNFVWMSSPPVGSLGLTASEPPPSVPRTGSFVAALSSSAPSNCPVGFADAGPVSADGLRSSVGVRPHEPLILWCRSSDCCAAGRKVTAVCHRASSCSLSLTQQANAGPSCFLAVN